MRHVVLLSLLLLAVPALAQTIVSGSAADTAELAKRRGRLVSTDIDGRLDLARWCKDRALYVPMAELAQEALGLDPAAATAKAAYALLQDYDLLVPLPDDPAGGQALGDDLAKQFKHAFKLRATRHFLILYDTPEVFAAQRAAHVERAYDSFMFWLNLKRLRPVFLTQRLVVVVFKDRADFLAYAKNADHSDMAWVAGYYSQATNRMAFFDDLTSPEMTKANDQLEELRGQSRDLLAQVEQARKAGQTGLVNTLTRDRNALNQQIMKLSNQLETAIGLRNASKTVHEACHQLAFNTGIQLRHIDYPLYVSEGLATCFESEDGRGARGPGIVNYPRLGILKDALKAGKVLTLREVIEGPAPPPARESEARMSLYYAESWALYHYLYRNEREGLEKLLLAYREQPPDRPISKAAHLKLFQEAFGEDWRPLETRWMEYVKALPAKP